MVFLNVGLKNTTNVGRIERGLIVMGCVLDVARGVLRKGPDMPTLPAYWD